MQLRTSNFKSRVIGIVGQIPEGEMLTYKQVAQLAGSPRAYRAVGNIMNGNHNPYVPCHRVVKSDGTVGRYNAIGGSRKKTELLRKERAI